MDYEKLAKEYVDSQEDDWVHNKEKSSYNRHYYIGKHGEEIYAESDDDNTTEYYFVIDGNKYAFMFAYSYTSNDDKLNLYLNDYR